MNNTSKRIFIRNLPETLTQEQLNTAFSQYGQVNLVEIKERKELGPYNHSWFFAYITLTIDDQALTTCFQDFKSKKYCGEYLQLQIARESFLDRLKRERMEQREPKQEENVNSTVESPILPKNVLNEGVKQKQKLEQKPVDNIEDLKVEKSQHMKLLGVLSKKEASKPSQDNSFDLAQDTLTHGNEIRTPDFIEVPANNSVISSFCKSEKKQVIDYVIKSNKNNISLNSPLKIPSWEAKPIPAVSTVIEKPEPKLLENSRVANARRLQSMQAMTNSYKTQKRLIKVSLAYGAEKHNHKIVFGDAREFGNDAKGLDSNYVNGVKKKELFEGDESDFEGDFEIKEQFEGDSGQKLLELQSRYKNDKRFILDKRFIDKETPNDSAVDIDDLEVEKSQQMKILEEVLGKKIASKPLNENSLNKSMVKFDPLQPRHKDLFLKPEGAVTKSKKLKKEKHSDSIEEDLPQNPTPVVSKEVFYKVPERLKETFTKTQSQFSVLGAFGKSEQMNEEEFVLADSKDIKANPNLMGKNPFKYDSSDDEDEIDDIPHKEDLSKAPECKSDQKFPNNSFQSVFWTEPFFFKHDDFRLQEGQDFIEKVGSDHSKEFSKLRRDVKGIVRAKVKNTERKNKMFKKKLGGSKRRKQVRIKKALKR
ncbi:probable RNA-binding protein CG14230 [Euwallacea similis]|uniref:probable RNA-binding protein CG14230 n=1 Tax=Euwallacea similis TaxID=1736056 RepID=UPI00344BACE7